MPQFMIAYHGGNPPSTKEEGMAHMEKWKAWVAGLGDAVVNPGTPLAQSMTVTATETSQDTSAQGMMGFAVINADSMDEAVKVAQSDPFLQMGGTIRLSEMKTMG